MKKIMTVAMLLLLGLTSVGCSNKTLSDIVNGNSDSEDSSYHKYDVGETVHTLFFDFVVNNISQEETINGTAPDEGKKFVVVDMTIKNTFTSSISMYSTDFVLEWDQLSEDDDAIAGPNSYYDKAPLYDNEFEKEYALDVDESRTGVLVFQVPKEVDEVSYSAQDIYSDKEGNSHQGDVYFITESLY
ncbi:MAG: DUF4352 domain-containing protein [Erysipelotrichaceae bacterium]|nr:DUF4352 domain-containing protein [Erysipelotrichaceae bacterium]MDY6035350.1 DUF4352 domain-containing protein [Bulleidia sp.]